MQRFLVTITSLLFILSTTSRGQGLDSLWLAFQDSPTTATASTLAHSAEQQGRSDLALPAWEYLAHQSPKHLNALCEVYLKELRLDKLASTLDKLRKSREDSPLVMQYGYRLSTLRRLMGHILWIEVVDTATIAQDQLANYLNHEGVSAFSCDSLGLGFLTERRDRYIRPLRDTHSSSIRLVYGDLLPAQPIPNSIDPEATIIATIPDSLEAPSYPTLAPDGITLYFSAISNSGVGGRDIYMTRQASSGEYLQPVPLGLPYNSPGEDLLLAFNAERHLGYLVSDRYAPQGMLTIYRFVYNDGSTPEVPSNDPELLRQYAMLRPYRITQRPDVDYQIAKYSQKDPDTLQEWDPKLSFVIAPDVIYHKSEQFHSPQAATLYREYLHQQAHLDELADTLSQLRYEYHQRGASDTDLAKRILLLEERIPPLQEDLNRLVGDIRQLEAPYL